MSAVLTESSAPMAARRHRPWGAWLLAGAVLAFLLVFLLWPVGLVIYTAFVTETGALTLGHFSNFFDQSLLREAFFNS
jgi:iron(III) transport system permease protein